MSITFAPFDAVGRSRIAQLINKSNQFNLTTRRYTETEVQAMETDPHLLTLQIRLKDKFADHGMIGVVICRSTSPLLWEIDTWLMSCRVLGRRVEEAVLMEIVERASARGAVELRGRYIASGRNGMVAGHYGALGFSVMEESATESIWSLKVADFSPRTLPFEVSRLGNF
jgi:FkbH-like protein